MPFNGLVDEPGDSGFVQDVDDPSLDHSALSQLGDGLLDLHLVDAAQRHRGTTFGQQCGGGPADPAASACHDGDLAVQLIHESSGPSRPPG